MEEKQKKFSKKINMEKALLKNNIVIITTIISISTYILPQFIINFLGAGIHIFTSIIPTGFDFGIILEIISLILLYLTRIYIKKNDEIKSKKIIIYAIIPIVFLIIYDIIWIINSVSNIGETILYAYYFWIGEGITLFNIGLMIMIYKDLLKANNPETYKDTTDWFYEKYEDDDK